MAKWSMLSDEGSRVPLAETMPFSMSQPCTVTNLSSAEAVLPAHLGARDDEGVLAGPDAEAQVALGEFAVGRGEVSLMELGAPGLQLLEACVSGNGRGEELRCEFHAPVYFPCRFFHEVKGLSGSAKKTVIASVAWRSGFVEIATHPAGARNDPRCINA